MSYFRPQKGGKIGPRSVHSFSDSTSLLSQNVEEVKVQTVPIENCLTEGVQSGWRSPSSDPITASQQIL